MIDRDLLDKRASLNAAMTYNGGTFFKDAKSREFQCKNLKIYRDKLIGEFYNSPEFVYYMMAYTEYLISKINSPVNYERERDQEERPKLL